MNTETEQTLRVSNDEWERYGDELWRFMGDLRELCEKFLENDDEEDRSAGYLIHSTKEKMDEAFGEEDGLANRRTWTSADLDAYESAFKPFLAFVGLMKDAEGNPALENLIGLSMPAYRTALEGISLFRSRLPKEGGAA